MVKCDSDRMKFVAAVLTMIKNEKLFDSKVATINQFKVLDSLVFFSQQRRSVFCVVSCLIFDSFMGQLLKPFEQHFESSE